MSMKLKRSTVDDVKARFEFNKQKRQEKVKEYSLKERLQDAKEEQERMTAYSSQVSCIQLTKNCPEYKVTQKKIRPIQSCCFGSLYYMS